MNPDDPTARIQLLFQTVLRRDPTPDELKQCSSYLEQLQTDDVTANGPTGWSYGYGTIDEENQAVTEFAQLPVLRDGTFKGGDKLPDEKLGWTSLNRAGGHPGGKTSLCAIRRWTADSDCRVSSSTA
jgi:hypothetical protein